MDEIKNTESEDNNDDVENNENQNNISEEINKNENTVDEKDKKGSVMEEVFQWVKAIAFALVIVLVLQGFVFQPVIVKGQSMEDTLNDGQRLILYKLGYYFSNPKHDDIVVLQHQAGFFGDSTTLDNLPVFRRAFPDFGEINYIKRVIGVAGDKVDIRNGSVYVNDKKLNEPYAKGKTNNNGEMSFPQVVPEGKVFVLGDNRENSSDSRAIGFVDLKKIKGKAVFRIFPFGNFGSLIGK